MIINKEHLHENLLQVIEELEDYAFIFIDTTGRVMTWNFGAQNINGYTADEIVGKSFRSFYSAEDLKEKKPDKLLATASKFGKAYDEGWRVRKDGTKFWGCTTISAVHDNFGNLQGFGKLTRDLTEKKLAENVAVLDARNKELEQFNYIASHDLQEPLRTVSQYIHLLEEDYATCLDEVGLKYLLSIKHANERMKILVKSVLEYSRIGQDKSRTLVDCNLLVANVLKDLGSYIAHANANVTVGKLPTLFAHETELRQVFQNLLHNALKFRKKDVAPVVEIDCKRLNQFYRFSVSDNGIGIHPRNFDKIFLIFQRMNHRTDFDGDGIGLAYCKKIVEMHGGNIWVESERGIGSQFYFTLQN